ncbi:hypothetical protein BG004_003126, partial [Podila humilis]
VVSDKNWAQGKIQSLLTLSYHKRQIVRLRIKDGKLLSGDMAGQVAMWDTNTFACETVLDAAVGPIQLLDFSAKAMIMTVISATGICRIWSLNTKAMISSFEAHSVSCMTMSNDHLVLGNRDGLIQVVDFTTGDIIFSRTIFQNEVDIYLQNDTLIIATNKHVRILSIDTLQVLMTCLLPISQSIPTYCSVFHIRSLILLTSQHLLHIEWEPLYTSPSKDYIIDGSKDLPPNLLKPPRIQKTVVPPIATITSIAIGGYHPRVLTTNADRPSLNETIRVCPTPRLNYTQEQQQHGQGDGGHIHEHGLQDHEAAISEAAMSVPATTPSATTRDTMESVDEDQGIVLTSDIPEMSQYLEECGLKPSFIDVDEDVIVIGTSKGDIVVLNMMPQD